MKQPHSQPHLQTQSQSAPSNKLTSLQKPKSQTQNQGSVKAFAPQESPQKHNFNPRSDSAQANQKSQQQCSQPDLESVSSPTNSTSKPFRICFAGGNSSHLSSQEKTKLSQYNHSSPTLSKTAFKLRSSGVKEQQHQNLISLKKIKTAHTTGQGNCKLTQDSRALSAKQFASNTSAANSVVGSPEKTSQFSNLVQENQKLKENIIMLTKLIQEVVPALSSQIHSQPISENIEPKKITQSLKNNSKSRAMSQNHLNQLQNSIQQLQKAYLQKQQEVANSSQLDSTFLQAEDLNSSSIDERILDSTPLSKQKSHIEFSSTQRHPNFQTFGGSKQVQDAFMISFRDQAAPPLSTGQRMVSHSGQKKTKMSDLNRQCKNFNMPISLDMVSSKKKIIDFEGVKQLQGMIDSINKSEIWQELKLIQPHSFKLQLKENREECAKFAEATLESRNQLRLLKNPQNQILQSSYSSANGDSSISDDEMSSIPTDSILHKQLVSNHQTIQKQPFQEKTQAHNNLQNITQMIKKVSVHQQNSKVLAVNDLHRLNQNKTNSRPNFKQAEQFYPKIMMNSDAQNFFSCTSVESINDQFSPRMRQQNKNPKAQQVVEGSLSYDLEKQLLQFLQKQGAAEQNLMEQIENVQSESQSLEVTHEIKIGQDEMLTTYSDQQDLNYEIKAPAGQDEGQQDQPNDFYCPQMFDAQNQSSQMSQLNIDISMVGVGKTDSNQISILMIPQAVEESHDNTRFELDMMQQAPLSVIKEEVSCSYDCQDMRKDINVLPSPREKYQQQEYLEQSKVNQESDSRDNSTNTIATAPFNGYKRQSVDPVLVNLMRNESPLKNKDNLLGLSEQDETIQQSYRNELGLAVKVFDETKRMSQEAKSSSRKIIQKEKKLRSASSANSPNQKLNRQGSIDSNQNLFTQNSQRMSLTSNRVSNQQKIKSAYSQGPSPRSNCSKANVKISASTSNQILDDSAQAQTIVRGKSLSHLIKNSDFSKTQQVNLQVLSDSATKPFDMIQNKWPTLQDKEQNLVKMNQDLLQRLEQTKSTKNTIIKCIQLKPLFAQQERSMEMMDQNQEPLIIMSEPDEAKQIVDNLIYAISPPQTQVQETEQVAPHLGFNLKQENDNFEISSFSMTIQHQSQLQRESIAINKIEAELQKNEEEAEREDFQGELTIENFQFEQIVHTPIQTQTTCPIVEGTSYFLNNELSTCRRETLLDNNRDQHQSQDISFNQTFNAFQTPRNEILLSAEKNKQNLSAMRKAIDVSICTNQIQITCQGPQVEREREEYLEDYDLASPEVVEELKELDRMSTPTPRNLNEVLEVRPQCQTSNLLSIQIQREAVTQCPSTISYDIPELREFTQESFTYKTSQLDHLANEYLKDLTYRNERQSIRSASRSNNNRSVSPNHLLRSQYSSGEFIEVSAPDLGNSSAKKNYQNTHMQSATSLKASPPHIAPDFDDLAYELLPEILLVTASKQRPSGRVSSDIQIYEQASSSCVKAEEKPQVNYNLPAKQVQEVFVRDSYSNNNNSTIKEEPSFEEQDSSQVHVYLERHSHSVLQSQRLNLVQQQLTDSQMTNHTQIEDYLPKQQDQSLNYKGVDVYQVDMMSTNGDKLDTSIYATMGAQGSQAECQRVQITEEDVSLTHIDMGESEIFSNFNSNQQRHVDDISHTQIYLSAGGSSIDKQGGGEVQGYSSIRMTNPLRAYVNIGSCSSKQSSPQRDSIQQHRESLLRKPSAVSSCKHQQPPSLRSSLLSLILSQDRTKQILQARTNISQSASHSLERQNNISLTIKPTQPKIEQREEKQNSASKSRSRERSTSNNLRKPFSKVQILDQNDRASSLAPSQKQSKLASSTQKIQAAKERREKLEVLKSEQLKQKMDLKTIKIQQLSLQNQITPVHTQISNQPIYQTIDDEQQLMRLSIDNCSLRDRSQLQTITTFDSNQNSKSASKPRVNQVVARPKSNSRFPSNTAATTTPVSNSQFNLQMASNFSIPTKGKQQPQLLTFKRTMLCPSTSSSQFTTNQSQEKQSHSVIKQDRDDYKELQRKIVDKEERVRSILEKKLQIEERINQRKLASAAFLQPAPPQMLIVVNELEGEGQTSTTTLQDDQSEISLCSSRASQYKRQSLTRGNMLLVRTPSQGLQQKMVLKSDTNPQQIVTLKKYQQTSQAGFTKQRETESIQIINPQQKAQSLSQVQSMKSLRKFSGMAAIDSSNCTESSSKLQSAKMVNIQSLIMQQQYSQGLDLISQQSTDRTMGAGSSAVSTKQIKLQSPVPAQSQLMKLQPKTQASARGSYVHSRIEQLSQN